MSRNLGNYVILAQSKTTRQDLGTLIFEVIVNSGLNEFSYVPDVMSAYITYPALAI